MTIPPGRLLGLDFGSRRIGLAVSDPLGITAQPLPALERRGERQDVESVAARAAALGVEGIVIGLPLRLDGSEGPEARKALRFGEALRERLGMPVLPWDERLTTAQAERHLIDAGLRREKRREVRDSLAALFILQSALDARNRT